MIRVFVILLRIPSHETRLPQKSFISLFWKKTGPNYLHLLM